MNLNNLDNMKKKFLLLGLMGVLVSCAPSYRIKEVTHIGGDRYYFPQKREWSGEWMDMSKEGSFTKEWAVWMIKEDKGKKSDGIKYLKID